MSNFKLAIVAGHYMNTPGKRCLASLDKNETREWWLNNRIVTYIEDTLASYSGIDILRLDDPTGKKDITLTERTNAANKWKADFYLSIHHNAGINGGSGGGIVAYVYSGTSDATTLAWQKELYNALIAKSGLKGNRGTPLAKANLHECRETSMPAVLLELGFMDSSTDVPVILTDKFAKACAEACVEVIVKRAGLKKKATSSTSTTSSTVNVYNVVTKINKYSTAADAKSQKNSKGSYEAGTYYIYNKYPDGINGMFNISTDKTGASAGSWINPAENVVETKTETTQKLYRVRKSKDDAKSQVGAYSSLDNAKEACQQAGVGYSVFDWDWKVVYSYTTPKVETTTKEPEVKQEETKKDVAVYDLNYAVKAKIINTSISRTNTDCVKAITLIKKNNSKFDETIAKTFFELAPKYNIDPVWAIAQSCLETGWFKYSGSAVTPAHHNYCGLGVTTTGKPGATFDTVEDGIRAQLQHLYAYGCKAALPAGEAKVDPRFDLVTREIATYWEQLAGRWAVPGYDKATYDTPEKAMAAGNTYGQKIRTLAEQLLAMTITDTDLEKYFPTKVDNKVDNVVEPDAKEPVVDEPVVEKPTDTNTKVEEPVVPEVEPEDVDVNVNTTPGQETEEDGLDKKSTDLATLIFECLKKLIKMIADVFSKGE